MNGLRVGRLKLTWSRLEGQWRVWKVLRDECLWVFMLGPLSVWWGFSS